MISLWFSHGFSANDLGTRMPGSALSRVQRLAACGQALEDLLGTARGQAAGSRGQRKEPTGWWFGTLV